MKKMTKPDPNILGGSKQLSSEEVQSECGVIMPISASINHDASHWLDVQTLHHRGIELAGLKPKNVWTGSAVDRITPRILGSLLTAPIALCDISDLNPNVMLELGLRLASKKPTIVVAEEGSTIPFDIKDFETLMYPANLNLLGMERYFEQLAGQLTSKLEAVENGTYEPFLSGVTFDYLEPEGRAIPFEKLVESRLDAITTRLDSIEFLSSLVTKREEQSQPHSRIVVSIKEKSDKSRVQEIIKSQAGFIGRWREGRFIMGFGATPSQNSVDKISKALTIADIEHSICTE